MVSFLARPCSTIFAVTVAFSASAPTNSFLTPWTAKTLPKLTFSPTLPSTRSMRMVSPGATRYCFPPVWMTAYISPPSVLTAPLSGFAQSAIIRGISDHRQRSFFRVLHRYIHHLRHLFHSTKDANL